MSGREVPVVWMRGGASKGLFVAAHDLPGTPRARDALLLRLLGGPDPGGARVDGLGDAGPARVAVVSRSREAGHDVDVMLGAAAAGDGTIDWAVSCDELLAAAASFAIATGLYPAADGEARVRMRRLATDVRVDAWVPVRDGRPVEHGGFVEDGVAFGSAELRLEVLGDGASPFPGGAVRERLAVAGLGELEVTLTVAGEPTAFVRADALGLDGRESPEELARQRRALERIEALRAAAARRLEALGAPRGRPPGPVVAWVARPAAYRGAAGTEVAADAIDLLVRAVAGGRMRPACPDAAAIAVAVCASVPGTVVADVARTLPGVATRIGHAGGTVAIGADVARVADGGWRLERCVLSHGARRLLAGTAWVPAAS